MDGFTRAMCGWQLREQRWSDMPSRGRDQVAQVLPIPPHLQREAARSDTVGASANIDDILRLSGPAIRRVCDFTEAHIDMPIPLDDLAALVRPSTTFTACHHATDG